MFEFDKTVDGWKLVEDVGMNPSLCCLGSVDFVRITEKAPEYISGTDCWTGKRYGFWRDTVPSETFGQLAREQKACLGQLHAEHLLRLQALIPAAARKYVLVFPGTVWECSEGKRCIPVVQYESSGLFDLDRRGGWALGFGIIGPHSWGWARFRFVRPCWVPDNGRLYAFEGDGY